ncbi:FAD-dependent monooxygenase [Hyphomicrobium sp.]|uniref:NAD(P)/FAD-dependent oxidoreductase n=1 Tax=Hyphomicrobium sp. TaxID=82 RepID=UPI001D706211|nr:FAD-dependent monooxygenase [Hyphomicrobium sp.]MBY0558965.1 FAD-dependent monooxygenase [Hyphomicrobium sp.]
MTNSDPSPDEAPLGNATADAIAVGGGLAGSAFALELARHGASVMIFERMGGPHHKVCGEFLSDGAQALLSYVGIDVHALGGSSIDTLCLANGSKQAHARLPFKAVAVSRFLLDEAVAKAAEHAGAKIFRATSVEGIEHSGDCVRVRTARATFECRAAALASGKHNIRGLPRPDGPMVGFKIHVRPTQAARAALIGIVHLIAFAGGYLGLCMVDDQTLSIAWNINSDVLRFIGTSWAAQSAYVAMQSRMFADFISGATPVWEKPLAVAGLPYGFMRSATISPAIYPVGDQLAVIPSFAGDGTALALASGIAAAQAVLKCESAPDFQARMLANFKPQFTRAAALDRVIAGALLRRVGIAGARLFPGMVTMLVSGTRLRGLDGLTASPDARN